MKIFKPNIHKLSLSIALIGTVMIGQSAWACEKPNVSGYDSVRCLKDGLALAKKNNRYNLLDKSGQVVTELTYDVRYYDIGDFEDGLAKIEKHNGSSADITGTFQIRSSGLYGFIDKTGKVVIPIEYDDVDVFSGGMVRVEKGGKYGFIDKTGKIIFPIVYSKTNESRWGNWITFGAKRDGKQVTLAKSGVEYDDNGKFEEGRIWVKKNSLYGYIDRDAKEVIPLIYQYADDFSNGLARVEKDGKWGYIDTNGKTIIDFKYDNTWNFENGKAKVESNDDKTPKYFYIDKTGKILTTRTNLADFRKKLEQGDDVYYKTADDSGKGMIFEIKGNLVQVQTKESQCSQRDYKGNCQNYIENQVGKWVKKSEVYPTNHFD